MIKDLQNKIYSPNLSSGEVSEIVGHVFYFWWDFQSLGGQWTELLSDHPQCPVCFSALIWAATWWKSHFHTDRLCWMVGAFWLQESRGMDTHSSHRCTRSGEGLPRQISFSSSGHMTTPPVDALRCTATWCFPCRRGRGRVSKHHYLRISEGSSCQTELEV